MLLFPLSVIVYGPPADGVFILIFHLASPVATTESTELFQDAVINIFSAGSAQPQIVALDCCCNTMLLEITAGRRIPANDIVETSKPVKSKKKQNLPFIV